MHYIFGKLITPGVYALLSLGIAFLAGGIYLLWVHSPYPEQYQPKLVTAYTDGVLQKNGQNYTFSFQFKTYDQFAERNNVMVRVDANLPLVTSECVKIRFEGAANYSNIFEGKTQTIPYNNNASASCQQTMSSEIVLFKQRDSYQNKNPLTIQYGMNGNWGVWYFNPDEKQIYGDYVPNIIHISPAETLLQIQTNYSQNYFSIILVLLTFTIAGATFLHLAIAIDSKKKSYLNNNNDHTMSKNLESGSVWQKTVIAVLGGIMIIMGIFTTLNFFVENVQVTTIENKMTVTKVIPALVFNDTLWQKFNPGEILIGILSAAAAILAVAFTITQLLISNISERYTPHVLLIYFRNRHHNTPFFLLIFVVALSAALLMTIENVPPWLGVILIIITAELFLLSLIAFIKNYYDIFRIINPLSFLDYLKNTIMENIRQEGQNAEEN